MIDVDKAIRDLWDAHGKHGRETASEAQTYESAREVLEALPDADSQFAGYTGRVFLTYIRDKEGARSTRSDVQGVLGVIAERELNERDGYVTFRLSAPLVHVTITGADAAPGCEIVAYEEVVTKYRMDCGDDDEEVVADLAAESGSPVIGIVETVDGESVTAQLSGDVRDLGEAGAPS